MPTTEGEDAEEPEPDFEFQALMYATGAAFTLRRDRWLQETLNADHVAARLAAARSWRVHATAVRLLAWSRHRVDCRVMFEELRTRGVETFPTDWEVGPQDMFYGHQLGMLASRAVAGCAAALGYEALLEPAGRWRAPWRRILLHGLLSDGPRAVDALFDVLEHVDDIDDEKLVLNLLGEAPRALVRQRLRVETARFDEIDGSFQLELGIAAVPARTRPARAAPSGARPPRDEITLEFESLKYATGDAYTEHRDAFVGASPASPRPGGEKVDAFLRERAAAPDWRTAITARILLGHRAHGTLFYDVQAELASTPIGEPSRGPAMTKVGHDPALQAALVPLAWEVLLKRQGQWPFAKRAAFFQFLADHPEEDSVEPLFDYLEDVAETSVDRTAALHAIARLPRLAVRRRADASARPRMTLGEVRSTLERRDAVHGP